MRRGAIFPGCQRPSIHSRTYRLLRHTTRAIKLGNLSAKTSGEITKARINFLSGRNVFQNVSDAASGAYGNGVTRIELSVVEIEF